MSWYHFNFVRLLSSNHACLVSEWVTGNLIINRIARCHSKVLGSSCNEHEKYCSGKRHSNTHSNPSSKSILECSYSLSRQQEGTIITKESVWDEIIWLLPHIRIMVQSPGVDEDISAFRELVTTKCCVLCCCVCAVDRSGGMVPT